MRLHKVIILSYGACNGLIQITAGCLQGREPHTHCRASGSPGDSGKVSLPKLCPMPMKLKSPGVLPLCELFFNSPLIPNCSKRPAAEKRCPEPLHLIRIPCLGNKPAWALGMPKLSTRSHPPHTHFIIREAGANRCSHFCPVWAHA